ncbi:MAG: hypothetical protein ACNA78_04675 [Balneolaceae bacterium]
MNTKDSDKNVVEGYVYTSYGKDKYLRDAIVSATTIRRHDTERPIALFCSEEHREKVTQWGFDDLFHTVGNLKPENRSIVGFKHFLHEYMPFDRNMYLDSDMIICRSMDRLWEQLSVYGYTITGQDSADVFYGAPKSAGVMMDILLRRRQRTLRRFGLSHLYRVQTGIMYAADPALTRQVNELAQEYMSRQDETHFISRTNEAGRTLESCEWSLGMAMSKLQLYVYPWFNGYESPQLDYIHGMVEHDADFTSVQCLYYCNPFIHGLRGIQSHKARKALYTLFSVLPRSRDHMWVTPYVLHFGWKHQKSYFDTFVGEQWSLISGNQKVQEQ